MQLSVGRRRVLVAAAVVLLAIAAVPWPDWLNGVPHVAPQAQPAAAGAAGVAEQEAAQAEQRPSCPLGYTSSHLAAALLPDGHPTVW